MRHIIICCVLLYFAFRSFCAGGLVFDPSDLNPVPVTIFPFPTCTRDAKICFDLTVLYRNPFNNCRFPKCDYGCPDDVCECPDGEFVTRNRETCLFNPCKYECPNSNQDELAPIECEFGKNNCPVGMYCEVGEGPHIDGTPGWCCQDPFCIVNGDKMYCIDGQARSPQEIIEGGCQLPHCQPSCPDGAESVGNCLSQQQCGYEQYCVVGRTPYGQIRQGVCCPSKTWQRLCDYEHHIWKDYRRFLQKHKELMSTVDRIGNGEITTLVNRIYDSINCINQLICDIEEKKKQIEDGQFDGSSLNMIKCLWRMIRKLWYKSQNMEQAIIKLKKLLDSDQVVVLTEINNLKTTCLLEAARKLFDQVHFTGIGIMLELIPVDLNDTIGTAAYEICKKAEKLGLLYHDLLGDFGYIHHQSFEFFTGSGSAGELPVYWFHEKLKCIDEFAQLYYDIRNCCEQIALKNITMNELVKKLGSWLERAAELREKFRSCFPKKSASTGLKKAMEQVPNADTTKIRAISSSVDSRFKKIYKNFDKCIIKLRCEFLDLIVNFWRP